MDPLWAVAAAYLLGSAGVSVALVAASKSVAATVAALHTVQAAAGPAGSDQWTGAYLTEKDIGDAWAREHPDEAREYNAGQLTPAQAKAVVDTRPWEVDLARFDQTWGEGLDRLFDEEAEAQERRRRGQPAPEQTDGAATREAEKQWR